MDDRTELTDPIVNGCQLVSYPDPDPTAADGDVIHPQLWESGSGYETSCQLALDGCRRLPRGGHA